MRKPNAILHMTGYGLVYGLLLGMLYMWAFLTITSLGSEAPFPELFAVIMMTAYISFIFGALPGAILGFIEGWILWYLTRDMQLPMTEADIAGRRKTAFMVMGGLTFAGMLALFMLMFGFSALFSIFTVPPFVAGAAAVYAVHRYFLKLRAWGNVGKAKNKAKHGLTNQLAYEDVAEVEQDVAAEDIAEQHIRHP